MERLAGGIFLPILGMGAVVLCLASPSPAAGAELGTEQLAFTPIEILGPQAALTDDLSRDRGELIQASQVMERMFHDLGMVYDDPALTRYLEGVLPAEALGSGSEGFYYRIYVLKNPAVNAMTTPTGSIYINSGLLAALSTRDELRFVIGHEVHHVIDYDVVHQYQKRKRETGALKVFKLLAAPAVAVAIGESDASTAALIANVYTLSNVALDVSYAMSLTGFGRANEIESDEFTMEVLSRGEYDLNGGVSLFEVFDRQRERYGSGFQTHLFATHESSKDRIKRIRQYMSENKIRAREKSARDDSYDSMTRGIRIENARLNIKLRQYQHALDDLERLGEKYPGDAQVKYLMGKAYFELSKDRDALKKELSNKEWKNLTKGTKAEDQQAEWRTMAQSRFREALRIDPRFADVYRETALMHEHDTDYLSALENFSRYLELAADPPDSRYVKAKIARMKNKIKTENEVDTPIDE